MTDDEFIAFWAYVRPQDSLGADGAQAIAVAARHAADLGLMPEPPGDMWLQDAAIEVQNACRDRLGLARPGPLTGR